MWKVFFLALFPILHVHVYMYVHVSNPRTLMPLHFPSHPCTLSLTPSHPPHIPLLTLLHFLTPSLLTHPLHTLPTLTPSLLTPSLLTVCGLHSGGRATGWPVA